MHLHKFLHQTKFHSLIVNFRAELYAKARNKRTKAKFLHQAEDWKMFLAGDYWILFKKRHACHGTPWDYVDRSGRRKEISPRTSILFSTESESTDWREKLKQSEGQSYDWSWKSLVYGWQDEKDRRVIIDIIPCVVVTSLETDAFMAIVAYVDKLMVRSNLSARSRKEGAQGAVAILRKKKESKVVYLKTQIQWILFCAKLEKWDWTLRRDTPWNSQDAHLVRNQNSGKKRAVWRHYPKGEPHERNPCASSFAEWTPEETSWQADCDSKVAWKFAKNAQCWAREIDAQIKWILRGEGPETRQRDRAVTGKSANKRWRTSFCSRFRSVLNSAITRWNASGSFASYVLLKNTDIHLSGNRWNSTIGQKWENKNRTVIVFQQQFVFNIEINGSVKLLQKIGNIIRSSHDSKWQACMRETDADRSWQAGHGKPWTSIYFLDEMNKADATQGIPVWLQPFTVNREDLDTCARTFPWKSELGFGRRCFKTGDAKKNGSTVFVLTSANTERDLFHDQMRSVTWKQQSTKVNLGTITNSLPC